MSPGSARGLHPLHCAARSPVSPIRKVNHFIAFFIHFPRQIRLYCLLPAFPARSSGESESICREIVALSSPRYKPGARPFFARHAMPLTVASGILRACRSASRLLRYLPPDIGFCDIRLRRKYGSRLGHASLTACTACSVRRIRESEASRNPADGTCQCKSICIALGFSLYLHHARVGCPQKRIANENSRMG